MNSASQLNVDDILYFVYTDPGASTCLRSGIVFYFDENNILRHFEGLISEELRELYFIFPDKFTKLAAGLGNYGCVNKRATYAGCYRNDDSRNIIKLKLGGDKYYIDCYCPEAPFTAEREYPMSKYDFSSLWEEYEKYRWEDYYSGYPKA